METMDKIRGMLYIEVQTSTSNNLLSIRRYRNLYFTCKVKHGVFIKS